MTNIFNDLFNLPECAVVALINEDDQRVLVFYSSSLMSSLERLFGSIRVGESYCRNIKNDLEKIKFVILEVFNKDDDLCRNRMKVRTGFYMKEFKNKGYSLYKEEVPVFYRLKTLIGFDAREKGAYFSIKLLLVSNRNNKILVGQFYSVEESDEFKRKYYPNDEVNDIIRQSRVQSRGKKKVS